MSIKSILNIFKRKRFLIGCETEYFYDGAYKTDFKCIKKFNDINKLKKCVMYKKYTTYTLVLIDIKHGNKLKSRKNIITYIDELLTNIK